MTLVPGAHLGEYEIVRAIGAGGMGEVYLARDTGLGREVAIKVLPASFAADPDRLARFGREARLLASLNHPAIATLHGFHTEAATPFLVMELVEGETLADRLRRGPLPVSEALDLFIAIARGLEAAHEKGIIHRDLKPANLKLPGGSTGETRVKILDFGLAKSMARGGDSDPQPLSHSPTLTLATTQRGEVLGTAAYMSPEQAKGGPVDRRTDIFAFGACFYEALTGKRAFDGDNVAEIMAAVLKVEPDLDALPAEAGPALRRLLRRCLTKDPAQRLHDIGDARLDLEEARSAEPAPPMKTRPSLISRLAWVVGGGAVAAAALVIGGALTSVSSPPRDIQLQRMTEAVGNEESPALSPDDKAVAFIAPSNGRRQVFVRLLAGGAILQLTHDDLDHEQPRWTPDSAAIIYFTLGRTAGDPGTIWEIPAFGGSPRRLMLAVSGGDVSHDGRRIATFQVRENQMALIRAARDGSAPETVKVLPDYTYTYPRWSPNDRWIAYQRSDRNEFDKRIFIIGSTGGEPREIAQSDGMLGLGWLPDGSGIIYSSSAGSTVLYPPTLNLRVVNVDGKSDRQLTFGDISYVEPDVRPSRESVRSPWWRHAAARPTVAVAATRITAHSDIWRIPVDGEATDNVRQAVRVTHQTGVAQVPSTSPDETEAVFLSDSGGHGNLWVTSTGGSSARQITFERDPGVSIGVPAWSPTSNRIAFIVTSGGVFRQWLVNSDGSDPREFAAGAMAYWSPDGKWLYYALRREGVYEIEKIAADGGPPVPVRADDAATPAVGADGTLYWGTPIRGVGGIWDWSIRKARPEGAEAVTLAHVEGLRVPWEFRAFHPILSPDEKWLAQPLRDGATSNLWLINTHDGSLRRVTDYADRPILIARRVSWSRDGKKIYAAVAETDADIVLLQNLVPD